MIPWITGWTLAVFVSGGPDTALDVTSLATVEEFPSAWTERPVRFIVQFDGLVEEWDPYLTQFGAADWVAFSGWGDEDFTWEPAVYARPHRRLFVPRDTVLEDQLARADRYSRFEVHATCRAVFAGDAWFEVERLVALDGHVGEGTLVHVQRARAALQGGRFQIAFAQLERARQAPLPEHALGRLDLLKAEFEHEQRRWNDRATAASPFRGRTRR